MLFELSNDFDTLNLADISPEQNRGLQNLLHSHQNGRHILLGSRRSLKRISSSELFGPALESVAKSILEQHSEISGLAKTISFTTLVKPNPGALAPERSTQRFVFPLSHFANADSVDKPVLLVEDSQTDGKFFLALRDAIATQLGIGNGQLELEVRHGGGSRTADILSEHIRDPKLIYCIVDSDRRFPNGPIGETARRVLAVFEGAEPLAADLLILAVRETENLVPLEFCQKIYEEDPTTIDVVAKLLRLKTADLARHHTPNRQFLRYFDFKDGLGRRNIREASTLPEREFYLETWRHIHPTENEFCVDDELDDLIQPGVSPKLLRAVAQSCVRRKTREFFLGCMNRSVFAEEIQELGLRILSWSLAADKMRVN